MGLIRRVVSVFTALSFIVYFVMGQTASTVWVQAEEEPKDYIVCTQRGKQVKAIEKEHE